MSCILNTFMNKFYFIPKNPPDILDFNFLIEFISFIYSEFYYLILTYMLIIFVFVTEYITYFIQILWTYLPK